MKSKKICVLGGGNIGLAIVNGLLNSKLSVPKDVYVTRRNVEGLAEYKSKGLQVTAQNTIAVKNSQIVILAVQPRQLDELLDEISPVVNPKNQIIISVVSGATISAMKKRLPEGTSVVRAMPNTAIAIRESMTCLAGSGDSTDALKVAESIFNAVGQTLIIKEELMVPATALCACGIAFFLRAVRAASQGGIEIGFHSEEALMMAAQTAKGAATLLLALGNHPENEVDKVTTPRGCTISGLNQMEHSGFSSAMIKGIITSADKAAILYSNKD
ncbi:MAG: pyrroline-5-carboxylate reductase [Ignavibacteriales bacterium]|nr:pyrroline-5-carboxylate reductase [Ignavibacteriales bacterium]